MEIRVQQWLLHGGEPTPLPQWAKKLYQELSDVTARSLAEIRSEDTRVPFGATSCNEQEFALLSLDSADAVLRARAVLQATPPVEPRHADAARAAFAAGVWNKKANVNKLFRAKYKTEKQQQRESSAETDSDPESPGVSAVLVRAARIPPPSAEEVVAFADYYKCVQSTTAAGFAHVRFLRDYFPLQQPMHDDDVTHRPAYLARQLVACLPLLDFPARYAPIAILGNGQRFKRATGSAVTGLVDILIATTDVIARKDREYYKQHISALIGTFLRACAFLPAGSTQCPPLELFDAVAPAVLAVCLTLTFNLTALLASKCAAEYGLPVDYRTTHPEVWDAFTSSLPLSSEELDAQVANGVTSFSVQWIREQRAIERRARKQDLPESVTIKGVPYATETLLSQATGITELFTGIFPKTLASLEYTTVGDLYDVFLVALHCAAEPEELRDSITTVLDCKILFNTATIKALHQRKTQNEAAAAAAAAAAASETEAAASE
jgi:hypothetical protein